jgi:hypothetical protein
MHAVIVVTVLVKMALNNIGGKNITNKYYRQQKALAATSTRCAAFRAKFGR